MLVITLIPHALSIGNPLGAISWNQGRTLLAFRIGTPSSCVCEFELLSARTVSAREVPARIDCRSAGRRRPGPPWGLAPRARRTPLVLLPTPGRVPIPSMRTWGITGPLPWIARRPIRPMGSAGDARDRPKPPPSETGAGDARDRPKPLPSETGAVDARDMRKRPRARLARWTLVTCGNLTALKRNWRGGRS